MSKEVSGIDNIQKAREDILELMPTEYSAYIMTQLAGDFAFDLNEKIKASNSALTGLLELIKEVDDIAYNEKMTAYELSYWLKKQISPIMRAEEVLQNEK